MMKKSKKLQKKSKTKSPHSKVSFDQKNKPSHSEPVEESSEALPAVARSFTSLRMTVMWLFIFLLPTQFGRHFFFEFSYLSGIRSDYLAPTVYVTDILVALLAVLYLPFVIAFFKKRIILLSLVLLFINVAFHGFAPMSLYRFAKIIELLVIFAVFKNTVSRLPAGKAGFKFHVSFCYALLAGTFLQTILATWQFLGKQSVGRLWYFLGERYMTLSTPDIGKTAINGVEFLRSYGTFSHPNSMSGFYLLIYTFTLFSPYITGFYKKNTILLLSSILIFISFSKVAIIGFFLINVIYLVTKRKDRYVCKLCLLARFLVGLVLAVIIFMAKGDPLTISKRQALAANALLLLQQNILFGVGLGQYVVAQHYKISSIFLQPVHNIFLLFLTETGLIAGGIIFYLLFKYIYSSSVSREGINIAFVACLLVVMWSGFFDHYWLMLQQNWLLLPVIFGLLSKKISYV